MSTATAKSNQAFSQGPLSDSVLELVEIMHETVPKGREPGFTVEDWAPLAKLVDEKAFERVGPFRDPLNWQGYVEMLTQWVTHSEGWEPVIKRMTEVPGRVYMECEERLTNDGKMTPFHSLSIYEFNDAGKMTRIEVYMQNDVATLRQIIEKLEQQSLV
jgi:hypothetical protein